MSFRLYVKVKDDIDLIFIVETNKNKKYKSEITAEYISQWVTVCIIKLTKNSISTKDKRLIAKIKTKANKKIRYPKIMQNCKVAIPSYNQKFKELVSSNLKTYNCQVKLNR